MYSGMRMQTFRRDLLHPSSGRLGNSLHSLSRLSLNIVTFPCYCARLSFLSHYVLRVFGFPLSIRGPDCTPLFLWPAAHGLFFVLQLLLLSLAHRTLCFQTTRMQVPAWDQSANPYKTGKMMAQYAYSGTKPQTKCSEVLYVFWNTSHASVNYTMQGDAAMKFNETKGL